MLLNGRRLDREKLILLGVRDVTEQHGMVAALREGEERFRLVVEGAHDFAMLLINNKGFITAWNIGAERLLGFTENEAVGQDAAFIFTPEDRAALAPEREMAEAKAKGRAVDERWHVRKNGTRFWGSGVMSAVRNADGSLRGLVKILRDQTARKSAEDTMQAARETAEMTNRVKDEFLATLSHELRTPLSAVLLWAQMLHRAGPAPDPELYTEGLTAILSSAEAQKTLIEDLMDTSRIVTGKLRLQPRPVDLAGVVKDAVEAVTPAAGAKGVTIASDLDGAVGMVSADSDRLRQVFWNLLTNAVKFTPAGGRVNVGLWRRGNHVEMRVTDTGQGIDAAFLPQVFDAFRQGDGSSARRHGGLGLGLAVCKQLVELHGGTIGADSPGPGGGATFTVSLPLPRLPGGKAPGSTGGSPLASGTENGGSLAGIRVLLVEDEAETRSALSALIRRAGATVTAVDSSAAARDAFAQSRPDVVLSDIGLPEMDGYALLRHFREQAGAGPGGPIAAIALTAFAREEDRRRAREAGFQHYLTKPVEPDELLTVLQNAVQPTGDRS
jgi:PAS domain S-box-containing protein